MPIVASEVVLRVSQASLQHGEVGIDHELHARVGDDAEDGGEHAFVEASAVRRH